MKLFVEEGILFGIEGTGKNPEDKQTSIFVDDTNYQELNEALNGLLTVTIVRRTKFHELKVFPLLYFTLVSDALNNKQVNSLI